MPGARVPYVLQIFRREPMNAISLPVLSLNYLDHELPRIIKGCHCACGVWRLWRYLLRGSVCMCAAVCPVSRSKGVDMDDPVRPNPTLRECFFTQPFLTWLDGGPAASLVYSVPMAICPGVMSTISLSHVPRPYRSALGAWRFSGQRRGTRTRLQKQMR